MQILKMLEAGQITAEEAARLLDALKGSKEQKTENENRASWFRVRVTDTQTGRTKINVNIPMSLVTQGLKIGARFAPDVEELHVEDS